MTLATEREWFFARNPAAATQATSAAGVTPATAPPSIVPSARKDLSGPGMLSPTSSAAPTPAPVQLQQSQAQDLVGQLLDYQNQVGAGAPLPPQFRDALVKLMMGGGTSGFNMYSDDEDPGFGKVISDKLSAKSDADLIGAAAAHAEHSRDPSSDVLEKLVPLAINIGIGSLLGPEISGALGGGMLGGAGAGAILGGGNALLSGGDIGKGITGGLKGAGIGAGIGELADFATPEISDIATSLGLSPAEMAGVEDSLKNSLPAGAYSTPAGTGVNEFGGGYSTPATTTMGGGPFAATVPTAAITGMLTPGLNSDVLRNLDQQDQETLSKQPAVTGKDIQKYAKLAQQVNNLLGGKGGQPAGGPQREAGQSNEQYAQQLVQYLNLDAGAMAAQGLTPGSPEYYQYIMQQADAVINQVLGGLDVNAADLSQQLQGKTQQELQQLQRALFVRGQMDTLVGPGSYTDPFTGQSQDVYGLAGSTFQPSVGAYQRGLAHSTDELAGLRGTQALDYLHGMLGRNVDLFGMQGNQDARMLQARLEEMQNQQHGEKKRKGMFGDTGYWQQELNALSPDELQMLMRSMGGDEGRSRAALEQLLGTPGYAG